MNAQEMLQSLERELLSQISVRKLNLNSRGIKELPTSIGKLTNLQELYLERNKLTEIPNSIGKLTNLQKLHLSNNQLLEIGTFVGHLANLQELWLNNNQLTQIPSSIGQLTNLQKLILDNNRLAEIPISFVQLTNLQKVDLSNNHVNQLSHSIGQATNLKMIWISNNKFTEIPATIGQLTNLKRFDLQNNLLQELPTSFGQLTNLLELNLTNNKLKSIPISFKDLQSLEFLNLEQNNLEFPFSPYQLKYETKPTILLQFLHDISTPGKKWTQIKLVTLGHGGTGKTTLIKALKHKTESSFFSQKKEIEETKTTIGIDVHDVQFLNVMKYTDFFSKMKISVWDFAGQLEYSVNHQYFLSSWNVIYLLVIDISLSIKEQKEQIEYWIQYLYTHLQNPDEVPIIIVANRIDLVKDEELKNQTIRHLTTLKDGKIIKEYVLTSAKKITQIQDLVEILRQQCLSLLSKPESFTIPKLYEITAESLQKEDVPFLIDAKQYFPNWQDLQACFIFLHNIGVIMYNSRTMKICKKPETLAKLMSCFALNPIHEDMLDFSKEKELKIEKGQSILKEGIIKARFKKVLGETNSIKFEEAIKCLEEFDYCFKLSKEEEKVYKEKGYLFPSLRPEGCFALDRDERVRTLGIRILNDKSQFEAFFFFRFQVASRKLHERKNVIYSNVFRLQKENNFATIWFGKKGDIQLVIQGKKPIELWKAINEIVKETAQDFPGIQLKITYLCPGCVLEYCFSGLLKALPNECETMFSEGEERKKEDNYACHKFHKTTRKQIEEGFSKDSTLDIIEELIDRIEGLAESKESRDIHELIEGLISDNLLCSFLGKYWKSFANEFPEIMSGLMEIEYDRIPNDEKVRRIFLCIQDSPKKIKVDRILAYLKKIYSE